MAPEPVRWNKVRHCRIVRNSDYFSDEFSQYLCFRVSFGSNNLLSDYNSTRWSESQQKTYDLIKSLHDDGMGYRRISYYLNEKGIKTSRGNEWKNTTVFSVLKRYGQREHRIENVKTQEYGVEIGKFELKWMRG